MFMIYHGIILTDTMYRLRHKPMGAYRVADVLRQAGYNILVIDLYTALSLDELKTLLSRVVTSDTLFMGYSSTFFVAPPASDRLSSEHPMEFAIPTSKDYFIGTNQHVKSLNPNLKILYGGASVQMFVKMAMSESVDLLVDCLVDGYSETMVVDVVNNIRDGLPQKTNTFIKNMSLVNYDMKAESYDFRNHTHRWHEADIVLTGEALPIEVARGCVFKCKYCTFPMIGKNKNDMSYIRTEDRLLQEITDNYDRYKSQHYMILDDTFNERTDKMEMLLRVRDRAKIDITFSAYLRLDLIAKKPEQLPLIRDLNIVGQCFGIESLTREAAGAVGKGGDPDELVETIHKIHDIMNGKVVMETGHIIGLPKETPETLARSVEKLLSTPIDSVSFFALTLMQSAYGKNEVWLNPDKYGYTLIDDPYIIGKQTWKNDIWDYHTCFELAKQYDEMVVNSGRNKLGAFAGFGMVNLGYDFIEASKMPIKHFRTEAVVADTHQRYLAHKKRYFNALNSYLDQQGL